MVLNCLCLIFHNQQILIQLSQNTKAFMFLDLSQTNRYDASILSSLTFEILTFEMWCPFIIFGTRSLDEHSACTLCVEGQHFNCLFLFY